MSLLYLYTYYLRKDPNKRKHIYEFCIDTLQIELKKINLINEQEFV